MTRPHVRSIALLALAWLCAPGIASAELVYFSSGRTMSVRSHRVEGDSLVLALRGGGEVVCDRSLITRVGPDEVPYPEPEARPSSEPAPDLSAYAEIIDTLAREQGVDPRLVRAVIQVESGYRSRARSPKGAMGLMQLMPATARQYAVADPYEPRANIEAGVKHLRSLLDRFELSLALAAYNAGEAAVRRFGGIPPYGETREYVSRILTLAGLTRRTRG
jgi:hypothetical protein